MKASDLFKKLSYYNERILESNEVVIQIKLPFVTVGPQPTVTVEHVSFGFDWDAGKFIIAPIEPLTPSDRDFEKTLKDMQTKCGDLTYENQRLKAEVKRLKKQIEDMK